MLEDIAVKEIGYNEVKMIFFLNINAFFTDEGRTI